MAHPRDEELNEVYNATVDEYEKEFYTDPRPKYFSYATEANVRKCCEDVAAVMQQINAALPEPDPIPPTFSEGWLGSASFD